jgi:S1-C subfamily serine protease
MTGSRTGAPETEGGVLVTYVTPGGPADQQGLSRGDVILAVNDTPVTRPSDFRALVSRLRRGPSDRPLLFLIHSRSLGHTRYLAIQP